jgi:hypothetical protein
MDILLIATTPMDTRPMDTMPVDHAKERPASIGVSLPA